MPSSTSSSSRLTAADRPGVAQPVPVRDIPERPWLLMLLGALLLAIALTGAWEWHWRAFGVVPSIRDDDALWARQRRRIDAGEGDATVLIGSSRTLFDVQLPVWERLSGRRPIQLALVGTSPLLELEDLANDTAFKGRLLIGVAPELFFSGYAYRGSALAGFRKETPSQRVGKWLSMHLLEPRFAFYDEDFALFTVLRRQFWLQRTGSPERSEVRKLSESGPDRNTYLWRKLEIDQAYRALARNIWAEKFHLPSPTLTEISEHQRTLEEQIERSAKAVAVLRARGIPVLFVREPSVGDYFAYETRIFPRQKAWDVLIAKTGASGVYFEDYPELRSGYDLPEWSHMTRASAERYTAALYRIMERDFAPTDGSRW